MPYATLQDLIDRFGKTELVQRTDTTNRPQTTIDVAVVEAAIVDATALADGYLAKRYSVPVAPAPKVLTRVVADLARYYLHDKGADRDGVVATNYRDAITWLKDVSKGTVELEAAGLPAVQAGGGEVRVSAPDRIFSRDTLSGF